VLAVDVLVEEVVAATLDDDVLVDRVEGATLVVDVLVDVVEGVTLEGNDVDVDSGVVLLVLEVVGMVSVSLLPGRTTLVELPTDSVAVTDGEAL